MEEIKPSGIPETIEQAVEALTEFYANDLPQIREISQQAFKASAHFGVGKFIRNSWYLWWYDGHKNESWPKGKPALVKYFNDQGIVHPDVMVSILVSCFYRSVHANDH